LDLVHGDLRRGGNRRSHGASRARFCEIAIGVAFNCKLSRNFKEQDRQMPYGNIVHGIMGETRCVTIIVNEDEDADQIISEKRAGGEIMPDTFVIAYNIVSPPKRPPVDRTVARTLNAVFQMSLTQSGHWRLQFILPDLDGGCHKARPNVSDILNYGLET
jgi:hypothetical protein